MSHSASPARHVRLGYTFLFVSSFVVCGGHSLSFVSRVVEAVPAIRAYLISCDFEIMAIEI